MTPKKFLTRALKYLFCADYRFLIAANRGKYDGMDDADFLKRMFKAQMGYPLDLAHPTTFNEKLQWLKLYDRRPEYTMMVDKYLVRNHVAHRLGEEYLIPLLGVWDDPEKIDFDKLPDRFVLKCNHNSGRGMCICKDKSSLDVEKVKQDLKNGLAQDYYLTGREWPYRDVPRRIVCEEYITDTPKSHELTDYKVFCFDGKADCVMLCLERSSGQPKYYFFDQNWQFCRYNIRGINAPADFTLPKPARIDEMFRIAQKLSQGLPFCRIDLYLSQDRIYFGEMTFFPDSGFDKNLLKQADLYLGEKIKLPHKK